MITLITFVPDQVRTHVFCATRSNDFVYAVLHERKLSSIEYHAQIRIIEIVFLITSTFPRDLFGVFSTG